jgi:cell wall-associated NlpC family hydrolase
MSNRNRRGPGTKTFTISPLSPIVAPMKIFAPLIATLIACATLSARAADTPPETKVIAPAAATSESAGYLERAREVTINALALLGVRYKWGSDSPDKGFDCSGLVSHVFQQVAGLVLPRNSQGMSKVGEKIDKSELQPGDLVFFNTRRRPFSHVGIYIGEERFVHAPRRGGEVEVTSMQGRYWKKRYNGARRVPFSD